MMLNDSILILILGFLILSVALNFFLPFRIIHTIRLLPGPTGKQPLPVGTVLPAVTFTHFTRKQPVSLHHHPEYAKVLVFLSSKCDKCKSKLPQLQEAIGKTHNLGVMIRIVSMEKRWRIKKFLRHQTLLEATLHLDKEGYASLNPLNASPAYLFVDPENRVQAEGTIGDENWLTFLEQLDEEG